MVLRGMGKDQELLNTIRKHNTAYLGHIFRNDKYELLQLMMKGKIEGKRGPGRRQISWMRNIRVLDWARYADRFAIVVANLH